MSHSDDSDDSFGQARRHHLAQVNGVLRRPGMYGRDEMAERLLLEAMAAVDGRLPQWWAECDALRARGAFTATGVKGAYSNVLPAGALRDATTSVYAEIAHRLGWLHLDRALSKTDHRVLTAGIGGWVAQDRTLSQVIDTFGAPSLWIGGTNPLFPKTLGYTTTDPDDAFICIHVWNTFANAAPGTRVRGVHPEPVVLAVRHRADSFSDSFTFSRQGLRRRPTGDQQSPIRRTAWIFNGHDAPYPSAVFDTADAGLAWAAARRVTGILAEYPFGGAYDSAVAEGRFTPSEPHHRTPEYVAVFSPGLRHIHLINGQRD